MAYKNITFYYLFYSYGKHEDLNSVFSIYPPQTFVMFVPEKRKHTLVPILRIDAEKRHEILFNLVLYALCFPCDFTTSITCK